MPTVEIQEYSGVDDPGARPLWRMIECAAHMLPMQGPMEVFVHHNTLHAFEGQSFHDAVKAGHDRYHAEPYLAEQEFRRLHAVGRIADADIEAVIQEDLGDRANEHLSGLGTRCEIRLAMLRHPLHVGPDAELRWVVAETDALQRFQERATKINRARIISASKMWLRDSSVTGEAAQERNRLLEKFGQNSAGWNDAVWESFRCTSCGESASVVFVRFQ